MGHLCNSICWIVMLKQICNISFDSLSTGKRPLRCRLNRV
jgi:hypothetical protein